MKEKNCCARKMIITILEKFNKE